MSIHFILVLNRQGKTRLAKWFNNIYTAKDKTRFTNEIHRLISSRDLKYQSNFVEYQLNKLVYRRYAGLYFISSIDLIDSELSYLESLHFFVEILDIYFNNVCELDLVFNFYKLYMILDEIYLGGELQEILKQKILDRLQYLDKLD
ncbi:Adaptor protein complex sigma subunit [Hyphopichia burtonii NRRL Y-1933]|uniref:AP complex subunit sigma n=1 Tax=Hyphopichia burtonii NRRL Y-1933 TaxID=984485 RepID=A0A1E4RR28_9ASCO|nr:Adaptor protein complex sigma subunit [Hyphopichia burtonii NRRL Y-1933]ODV69744.1 Adaptor protein complex sigma subunit [Hyphopichia burtonii NRRL Y-1933]